MPKQRKFKPIEVEEREQELRKLYGGTMTIPDLQEEYGKSDRRVIEKWLNGLVAIKINGRLHFRVADVAQREYECRVVVP